MVAVADLLKLFDEMDLKILNHSMENMVDRFKTELLPVASQLTARLGPPREPTPPAATRPPAKKAADAPSNAPVCTAASAASRSQASTPPAPPSQDSRVPPTPVPSTLPAPTPPAQTPGPATTTGLFDLSVPRASSLAM
ncbi:hypothetical protein P692DRAFT_20877934 [Suillus brevipes Sb2]|nr:hypothetical protein P692DRAFT_20877934 [Suillus brevipes Sb2]